MGKATGEDGKDGVGGDGSSGYRFEFVYKRVADKSVVISKPENRQEDRYQPAG